MQFTIAVNGPAGTIDRPAASSDASTDAYLYTEDAYRTAIIEALEIGLGIPPTAVVDPPAWSRTRYWTNLTIEVDFPSLDAAALAAADDGFAPLSLALEAAAEAACPAIVGTGFQARARPAFGPSNSPVLCCAQAPARTTDRDLETGAPPSTECASATRAPLSTRPLR